MPSRILRFPDLVICEYIERRIPVVMKDRGVIGGGELQSAAPVLQGRDGDHAVFAQQATVAQRYVDGGPLLRRPTSSANAWKSGAIDDTRLTGPVAPLRTIDGEGQDGDDRTDRKRRPVCDELAPHTTFLVPYL